MLFGGRMNFQQFGDKLRRIDKTLIHFEEVLNKKWRNGKKRVVI